MNRPIPDSSNVETENESDERGILANQDATDPGGANVDDRVMGAGPTNDFGPTGEPADFVRGEVDVKTQMDRASKHRERHDWDLPDAPSI